jgi:hypothetical protein
MRDRKVVLETLLWDFPPSARVGCVRSRKTQGN